MKKARYVLPLIALLALAGCGGEKTPTPVEAPITEVPPESISAADKATIDALGTDLTKLATAIKSSSGAKLEYTQERFIEGLRTATDATLVDAIATSLPSSRAKMEATITASKLRRAVK